MSSPIPKRERDGRERRREKKRGKEGQRERERGNEGKRDRREGRKRGTEERREERKREGERRNHRNTKQDNRLMTHNQYLHCLHLCRLHQADQPCSQSARSEDEHMSKYGRWEHAPVCEHAQGYSPTACSWPCRRTLHLPCVFHTHHSRL